jgi:hypothetical protein
MCALDFFCLVCEAISTAATPGLLCQPRVIVKMIVEKQIECRLCRGNRISRKKPAPAPLLSTTKPHMTRPGFEPGQPRWEANDYIFYLVCEAIGNAVTPGLLCQPRVIVKMIVEKQMKCRLAGETEVLRENLPYRARFEAITCRIQI